MKEIRFRPQALKDLKQLDAVQRELVKKGIQRFASTGAGNIKALSDGTLRLRIGDWRVRFAYEESTAIRIASVIHGREAYRN